METTRFSKTQFKPTVAHTRVPPAEVNPSRLLYKVASLLVE